MKKKMFMMLCLTIMGMQVMMAQQSIIALHHEGKVTIFSGSKTQEAMDASVKGDTLYLSEGTFAGWNVTHGIVVLGSGERTVVSGNITITGNDEKKDLGGYVFSGLNLIHNFVVNDSVNGFKMTQCQMNNFSIIDGAFFDAGEIVMCHIKNVLELNGKEYGLDVISSKVRYFDFGGVNQGSVSFNHCNVESSVLHDYYPETTNDNFFHNCIVAWIRYSTWNNCLAAGIEEVYVFHTAKDCYKDTFTFDDKLNCSLPDDTLKARGYLGDDGTVVGITGGEIPYTLELATPHIADHKVDVDNVNRKLTVTLKMAHEATKEDE